MPTKVMGLDSETVSTETTSSAKSIRELVVCSLEPWDEVSRRNQFFVDALLRRNADLKCRFVEPPADVIHDVLHKRVPGLPHTRRQGYGSRLVVHRPVKPLPRRLPAAGVDQLLGTQVLHAVRRFGLTAPILWVNDVTYAPLIPRTGWASLYDITDDWLLAPFRPRESERLRQRDREALSFADEVVVCSSALAKSAERADRFPSCQTGSTSPVSELFDRVRRTCRMRLLRSMWEHFTNRDWTSNWSWRPPASSQMSLLDSWSPELVMRSRTRSTGQGVKYHVAWSASLWRRAGIYAAR